MAVPQELFDAEVPNRDSVLDQGFWFDPADRKRRLPDATMWPPELDDCPAEGTNRFVDRRSVFRIAQRATDTPDDPFSATQLLVASIIWGTGPKGRNAGFRLDGLHQDPDAPRKLTKALKGVRESGAKASRTSMASRVSKAAGWYQDPANPEVEAYWNGAGWTAHKWCPDPTDPEARLFWDGTKWTGDRRAATEPPFMPQNIDPTKPQRKDTDWVKVGGMALGVLAALEVATNSSRQGTASWDRARAQSDAYARQDRVRQYKRAHNQWIQTNWNNPNPPPPPLPPTY